MPRKLTKKQSRASLRRWSNLVDEIRRECQSADVPHVVLAIHPDNGQVHGGYWGPITAVAGLSEALSDDLRREAEKQNREALLLDSSGNALSMPKDEDGEEPAKKLSVPARRGVRGFLSRFLQSGSRA